MPIFLKCPSPSPEAVSYEWSVVDECYNFSDPDM